jgi:GDPmannose 4,6-dehydratase
MKAIITGINGQDGSYLSEHLLNIGYDVHGMIRRHSISESQHQRLDHIQNQIKFYYGDLTDQTSIEKILTEVKPDLIFNLGAQSHVRISFEIPQYTIQVNGLGVVNLLEAYRRICPQARFYQASSSEMFGLSIEDDLSQNENTPMNPTSPYGCAKVLAYNLVRHYRRAYGLHACNGILFNHESPRRGLNFVTQKVIKGAVEIKLGIRDNIELGNIGSFRDWGHSKDYTKAMIKIINHSVPDDFVIATGETHCIEEMCNIVFSYLGLDYKKYIKQNPIYMRPEELPYLKGDSIKARTILGWAPEISFDEMIKEMCDYWLKKLS